MVGVAKYKTIFDEIDGNLTLDLGGPKADIINQYIQYAIIFILKIM
jgi:hypothetical protein